MAERSFPYTTTGSGNAAAYTEAQTTEWLKSVFHPGQDYGVLRGHLNELAPTVSSGNISVNTGAAYVNGYWYQNDSAKSITVPTPAIGTTGHRIVLRLTYASDTIIATIKSSSDGVSSIPSLTQNGTTYEVSICQLTKTTGGTTTITSDDRIFAQYGTNHVKRTGDIMTGALSLETVVPQIRLIETDAAADNRRWQFQVNNSDFSISAVNDAGSVLTNILTATRTGTAVDSVNFPVNAGVLQRNGNQVWDSSIIGDLRRRGGNATNWGTGGTTNYTPANYRIQVGSFTIASMSVSPTNVNVTFPVAFSGTPVITATVTNNNTTNQTVVEVYQLSSTAADFGVYSSSAVGTRTISWIAIGPM